MLERQAECSMSAQKGRAFLPIIRLWPRRSGRADFRLARAGRTPAGRGCPRGPFERAPRGTSGFGRSSGPQTAPSEKGLVRHRIREATSLRPSRPRQRPVPSAPVPRASLIFDRDALRRDAGRTRQGERATVRAIDVMAAARRRRAAAERAPPADAHAAAALIVPACRRPPLPVLAAGPRRQVLVAEA